MITQDQKDFLKALKAKLNLFRMMIKGDNLPFPISYMKVHLYDEQIEQILELLDACCGDESNPKIQAIRKKLE